MASCSKQLFNAHHLRELKALEEIEKESWAFKMRKFLRILCHSKSQVVLEQAKEQISSASFWLFIHSTKTRKQFISCYTTGFSSVK